MPLSTHAALLLGVLDLVVRGDVFEEVGAEGHAHCLEVGLTISWSPEVDLLGPRALVVVLEEYVAGAHWDVGAVLVQADHVSPLDFED